MVSNIEDYLGVPVLVQLKFPLAAVTLSGKGRIPYADEPAKSQWVPEALMVDGSPSGTQLIMCAVLCEAAGSVQTAGHSVVEMRWASVPRLDPASGAPTGPVATLATLLDVKDIVAITRVVDVNEPSGLILKA